MISRQDKNDLVTWLHPGAREIFRDEFLWVLEKPAGVLSHPNPPAATTRNALLRGPYDLGRELYRLSPPGEAQVQVHLLHRLDQETSGIILCALHRETAESLKEDLFHRRIEKEYLALVLGVPAAREGEWADRLEKVSRGGRAVVTRRRGKANAVTRFEILESFGRTPLALLALRPETGRTHQLRVQSAARGHPIAGDERYGDFAANRFLAAKVGLGRMFLHAGRIELRHPATGRLLEFRAPVPPELLEALGKARALHERIPRRAPR